MFIKGRKRGRKRVLARSYTDSRAGPPPTGPSLEGLLATWELLISLSALPALGNSFSQVRQTVTVAQKVSLIPSDPKASAVPQPRWQGQGSLGL